MLEGVRIIELEGLGPAPFASMLLADLGADVIVVHRPVAAATPGIPEQPILDRGKRSIALDLKDPNDLDTLKTLIGTADALIEGFRPGVMERLGLGPDVCLDINPRLVFGRMTGWGQEGVRSATAGHDLNYVGVSGAAWHASPAGVEPFPPPTLVGDVGGGALYLVIGLLSGILNARQTQQGTVVDAAIVDGSAHMMNLLMTLQQGNAMSSQRGHGVLDGPHFSRCYRTKDNRYLSVQCLEPRFYRVFIEKLNLTDSSVFTEQFDQTLWSEQTAQLQAIFSEKTRDEWQLIFEGSDACVAPVYSPEEALNDSAMRSRGVWLEKEGVLQSAGAPRFSTGLPWMPKPSPERDEHRLDIIAELADLG